MEKRNSKKNEICLISLVLVVILFILPLHIKDIHHLNAAVEVKELFTSAAPIPKRSYKSWSLFLISNPDWLLPESNKKIKELYDEFLAFGKAIGNDHLAVWFWLGNPKNENFSKYVDVSRSSAFCSKFKLPPSKSPYLLHTTEYPGTGISSILKNYPLPDSFHDLENLHVLELNGLSASETIQLLTEIADQLVIEGLVQTSPKSEKYWRTWQKSYEKMRDSLVGLKKSIKITFNTSFFKMEYNPKGTN